MKRCAIFIPSLIAAVYAAHVLFGTSSSAQVAATVGTSASITQDLATKDVVQLQAGRYTIDKPLPRLREGQSLRGIPGQTRFDVTYTTNATDPSNEGKAVIYLTFGSTVSGININYPAVNPAQTPTMAQVNSIPWGVWVHYGAENYIVENVRIHNLPRGIMCYGGQGVIRNVSGGCWYRGLVADTCGHTLTIADVSWNEPLAVAGDYENNPLIKWQRENSAAFVFQRVDGLRAYNLFGARHRYGMLFTGSSPPYDTDFWWGSRPGGFVQGGGFECTSGIRVDWSLPTHPMWDWTGQTLSVSNVYFANFAGGTPVEMLGVAEPVLNLTACWFSPLPDTTSPNPYVLVRSGRLTMTGCELWNPYGDRQLFLKADSGVVSMTGGRIEGMKGQTAVNLGPGVRAATFSGVAGLRDRIKSSAKELQVSGLTWP